jgi:hypothetical protein
MKEKTKILKSKIKLLLFLEYRKRQELVLGKKKYLYLMMLYRIRMSIHDRYYLNSQCLLPSVSQSPWYRLYQYGEDSDLVTIISLTRNSFEYLLREFSKDYVVRGLAGDIVISSCLVTCITEIYY